MNLPLPDNDLVQMLVVEIVETRVGEQNFTYKPNPNITDVSPLMGIEA